MKLTPAQKKLLLQTVHCTKFLKPVHGNYVLNHNEKDNNWYYIESRHQEAGKASPNPVSWKHNQKFKLNDKEFSGVVVKIEEVLFSTTLGVSVNNSNNIKSCNLYPVKGDGCSVLAATIFYQNGRKRIVPLDCIIECESFSNGKETEYILNNLEKLISIDTSVTEYFTNNNGMLEIEKVSPSPNKISFKPDGTIEIENTYSCINPETGELIQLKRYLTLNVNKRISQTFADTDDEWFHITDEEYLEIMEIMNNQMKEECGFIPDLSYGVTNFDRLVNFANFPFAPELNEFSHFFNHDKPGSYNKDWYNIEYLSPVGLEEDLKRNPAAVREFIQLCGIAYTPRNNGIFLQGHRNFLEYLGIWHTGFRNEKLIDKIIAADEHKLFAAAINDCVTFGTYFSEAENDEEQLKQTCLCFTYESDLFYDIRFLFGIFNEKTVEKFTLELISEQNDYTTPDALFYFKLTFEEGLLGNDIINKIGKEGFTTYNHDLLMRIYNGAHNDYNDESFENQTIEYTDEEKNLTWENSGYTFSLPEDTNRLLDIGSKMNICVGHLYREKAVTKKCTIIYVVKDENYELCIEVQESKTKHFKLIQKSAFSNREPQGKMLEVFNQWCQVKGIFNYLSVHTLY